MAMRAYLLLYSKDGTSRASVTYDRHCKNFSWRYSIEDLEAVEGIRGGLWRVDWGSEEEGFESREDAVEHAEKYLRLC